MFGKVPVADIFTSVLVVDDGQLHGIFSMSEISKHMGHNESEPLVCAHSLAELVHTIG